MSEQPVNQMKTMVETEWLIGVLERQIKGVEQAKREAMVQYSAEIDMLNKVINMLIEAEKQEKREAAALIDKVLYEVCKELDISSKGIRGSFEVAGSIDDRAAKLAKEVRKKYNDEIESDKEDEK